MVKNILKITKLGDLIFWLLCLSLSLPNATLASSLIQAPSGVHASASASGVSISWTPINDSNIAGYEVLRTNDQNVTSYTKSCVDDNTASTCLVGSLASPLYVDSATDNPANSSSEFYAVRSVSIVSLGGAVSNWTTPVPTAAAVQPLPLSINGSNNIASGSNTGVSFGLNSDQNVLNNTTKFRIYITCPAGVNVQGYSPQVGFANLCGGPFDIGSRSLTSFGLGPVNNVTTGTQTVTVKVVAVDDGNKELAASLPVTFTVNPAPPVPPVVPFTIIPPSDYTNSFYHNVQPGTSLNNGSPLTDFKRQLATNPSSVSGISWTSSNTAIATVSSTGLVTGVGSGKVTITATVPGVAPQSIVFDIGSGCSQSYYGDHDSSPLSNPNPLSKGDPRFLCYDGQWYATYNATDVLSSSSYVVPPCTQKGSWYTDASGRFVRGTLPSTCTPLPSAPSAPTATASDAKVSITGWGSVAGATGYRLYSSVDNFTNKIGNDYTTIPTVTSPLVLTATNGTSYTFKVSALNSSGIEGPKSVAGNSVIPVALVSAISALDAHLRVTTSGPNLPVIVSWSPDTSNSRPAPSFYRLYRSGYSSGVNAITQSDISASLPKCVDIDASVNPTNLCIESVIVGGVSTTDIPSSVTSINDSPKNIPNQIYHYSVLAGTGSGSSAVLSSLFVVANVILPPAPPGNFNVQAKSSFRDDGTKSYLSALALPVLAASPSQSVSISWSPDSGSSSSYRIYRSQTSTDLSDSNLSSVLQHNNVCAISDTSVCVVGDFPPSSSSAIDYKVSTGQIYTYRMITVNRSVTPVLFSRFSSPATAILPPATPAISASIISADTSGTNIKISIAAPSTGAPSGYRLYRSGSSITSLPSSVPICSSLLSASALCLVPGPSGDGNISGSSSSVNDQTAKFVLSQTYHYAMLAANIASGAEADSPLSQDSPVSTVTMPSVPSNAPLLSMKGISSGVVNLSWTPVSSATYEVLRSTVSGATSPDNALTCAVSSNASCVFSPSPSSATTFSQAMPDTTKIYYYRVRAVVSGVGDTNWSNEVMAVVPQFSLSLASAPVSQSLTLPQSSKFTFANIQIDTSSSGEGIIFSNFNVLLTTSAAQTANNLKNCGLYDGSKELTTGQDEIAPLQADSTVAGKVYTFNFDKNLDVPKGGVKTLSLECDVVSSALPGTSYSWGKPSPGQQSSGVGDISGKVVIPSASPMETGPIMTITAPPLTISSGPVSSLPSSSSVTISWVTNRSSDSAVYYSTNSNVDVTSATNSKDSTQVSNHSVSLPGLLADKTYYFVVESVESSSGLSVTSSPASSFKTSPAPVLNSSLSISMVSESVTSSVPSFVVAPKSGIIFGHYIFDASNSETDVSIPSFEANLNGSGQLSNCRIVNETNPSVSLSSAISSVPSGKVQFVFSPPLAVSSRNKITLAVSCDVDSSATPDSWGNSYNFGLDSSSFDSVSGVGGSQFNPTVVTGAGPSVEVEKHGRLVISADKSTTVPYNANVTIPAESVDYGPDDTVLALRFEAKGESINLLDVPIRFDNAGFDFRHDPIFMNYTVWDGSTKVGTGIFNLRPDMKVGMASMSSISNPTGLIIPKDSSKVLSFKFSANPYSVAGANNFYCPASTSRECTFVINYTGSDKTYLNYSLVAKGVDSGLAIYNNGNSPCPGNSDGCSTSLTTTYPLDSSLHYGFLIGQSAADNVSSIDNSFDTVFAPISSMTIDGFNSSARNYVANLSSADSSNIGSIELDFPAGSLYSDNGGSTCPPTLSSCTGLGNTNPVVGFTATSTDDVYNTPLRNLIALAPAGKKLLYHYPIYLEVSAAFPDQSSFVSVLKNSLAVVYKVTDSSVVDWGSDAALYEYNLASGSWVQISSGSPVINGTSATFTANTIVQDPGYLLAVFGSDTTPKSSTVSFSRGIADQTAGVINSIKSFLRHLFGIK